MALTGFTSLGVPLLGHGVRGQTTDTESGHNSNCGRITASAPRPIRLTNNSCRVHNSRSRVAIPPHFVAEHIAPAPCCVWTTNSRESWATTSGLTHMCDSILGTDFTCSRAQVTYHTFIITSPCTPIDSHTFPKKCAPSKLQSYTCFLKKLLNPRVTRVFSCPRLTSIGSC